MGGGPDMPPGGLNRTFYGIETISVFPRRHSGAVLIVPFMELKQPLITDDGFANLCLNRTFYGIETCVRGSIINKLVVLIVPFMELKLAFCLKSSQ